MDNSISMYGAPPVSTPPIDSARRQPAASRPSVSDNVAQPPTDSRSPDVALQELEPTDIEAALERVSAHISEYSRQIGRALEFHVERNSDRVIILVTNKDSGELVRAIPLEEVQPLPEYLAAGEPALVNRRA